MFPIFFQSLMGPKKWRCDVPIGTTQLYKYIYPLCTYFLKIENLIIQLCKQKKYDNNMKSAKVIIKNAFGSIKNDGYWKFSTLVLKEPQSLP